MVNYWYISRWMCQDYYAEENIHANHKVASDLLSYGRWCTASSQLLVKTLLETDLQDFVCWLDLSAKLNCQHSLTASLHKTNPIYFSYLQIHIYKSCLDWLLKYEHHSLADINILLTDISGQQNVVCYVPTLQDMHVNGSVLRQGVKLKVPLRLIQPNVSGKLINVLYSMSFTKHGRLFMSDIECLLID